MCFVSQTCGLFLLFLSLWSLLDPSRGPFLNLIAAAGKIALYLYLYLYLNICICVCNCNCIFVSVLMPKSHFAGEDLLRLVCFLQFVAGCLVFIIYYIVYCLVFIYYIVYCLVRPLLNLQILDLQHLCMIFANCIWLLAFKTRYLDKIIAHDY